MIQFQAVSGSRVSEDLFAEGLSRAGPLARAAAAGGGDQIELAARPEAASSLERLFRLV